MVTNGKRACRLVLFNAFGWQRTIGCTDIDDAHVRLEHYQRNGYTHSYSIIANDNNELLEDKI